jgi:predicted nucleic acid-binding protein
MLDTQIWIYLHPKSPASMTDAQKQFHLRARLLAAELEEDDAEIVVPTVLIGEYLVGCDQADWVRVVQSFAEQFVCPDFDLPACQQAALVRQKHLKETKGQIYKERRNVLSADVKILGTALAQRVKRLYTCDADFRKLASSFIEALDLPTHGRDLFRENEIRHSLGMPIKSPGR